MFLMNACDEFVGLWKNQITSIKVVSDFDFAVCYTWGIAGGVGGGGSWGTCDPLFVSFFNKQPTMG